MNKKYSIFILTSLLMIQITYAQSKIMSFNTMCDLCKGSDFFDYENRLHSVVDIIKSYSPDLIALQEIRSQSQIETILKQLPNYDFYNKASWPFNYSDPTIFYNFHKFTLIEKGQGWLGPNPDTLNFGWKLSLPRQYLWVKLQRVHDKKVFIFATSHFDNRLENLAGSAKLINQTFRKTSLPIIFAADTNLTTEMSSYQTLVEGFFYNSFDLKKNILAPTLKTQKDFCYLKKGKIFPDCRVDHLLLSKTDTWEVNSFHIDQTKNYKNSFPSDHRPIIINLSF